MLPNTVHTWLQPFLFLFTSEEWVQAVGKFIALMDMNVLDMNDYWGPLGNHLRDCDEVGKRHVWFMIDGCYATIALQSLSLLRASNVLDTTEHTSNENMMNI